jgi:hypothetical protein
MAVRRILTDLDFENVARLLNLADATDPQEPVTLAQLRAAVEGIDWKENVRVSTQGNLNLSAPGASIDGETMVLLDRVLVRAQSAPAENGLYVWNGAAVAMSRALDANTLDELIGAVVTVNEGSDAGTSWRQETVAGVLGTDPITWASFGAVAPPASETVPGIAEIATQAETNTGTDDTRFVTPLKLANWSNRKLAYDATFGDGSNNQFTLTHNLGTRDVHVSVREAASPYDEVVCQIEYLSTTQVRLTFVSVVGVNELRAVIRG